MKFSDIVAKLTNIESRLSASDKAEIDALKAQVDGALTDALSKVEASQKEVERLTGELTKEKANAESATNLVAKLNAACESMKVEDGDKAKIEALTPEQKVDALQNAVNAAIAKTGVNLSAIPTQGPETKADAGTKTLQEFEAMSFAERNQFIRAGGKLK